MSSTRFVFFGPIGKPRRPHWPLIGSDILDFFSASTGQNSTKLYRKQDLNVLYRVCDFRADRKTKMASLSFDWLKDIFSVTAERNSTELDRKQDLNASTKLCFRADRKTKMTEGSTIVISCRPSVRCKLPYFLLLLWNHWTEFNETWQEERSRRPQPSLCFRDNWKHKMNVLASDWLRHFRLLIWNHWTEFI